MHLMLELDERTLFTLTSSADEDDGLVEDEDLEEDSDDGDDMNESLEDEEEPAQ